MKWGIRGTGRIKTEMLMATFSSQGLRKRQVSLPDRPTSTNWRNYFVFYKARCITSCVNDGAETKRVNPVDAMVC